MSLDRASKLEGALAISAAVRSGEATAADVLEATLARIAQDDPALGCFTEVTAERAWRKARAVDAALAEGRNPGPLAGVPFAVKNLFDIEGLTTLAGARIRSEAPPAAADATAVARMLAAGAVLVGAANMDEFAYGFSTENAHFGTTRNPHAPDRISGGSSGGSAAAVARRLVPLALGSDTNGSIRVPAALCGVYGFKPTFGRLSRAGAFPFVGSLDHVGPFAATVADLAAAYDVLQGPDPADPACALRPAEPILPRLYEAPGRLRVGVLDGWFREGATADALEAVDEVASALGATTRVELPEAARARSAAFCITAAEGGALHLPTLRARAADYDPATCDRLLAGALLPASVIAQAQRFRRWFHERAMELFARFDLLLAPTTLCVAPLIGQATIEVDGESVAVRSNLGVYTQPLSFIGLPVLSAPVVTLGPLPLGVQLVAAPWREDLILQIAQVLEDAGVLAAPQPRLA